MSLSLHLTKKMKSKKVDESSRPLSRFQISWISPGKIPGAKKNMHIPPCFLGGHEMEKIPGNEKEDVFSTRYPGSQPNSSQAWKREVRVVFLWFFLGLQE